MALVAAVAIVIALATLQPLLLPLVIAGYIPLVFVTRLNTRDSYLFSFGMTPNDRQRTYLQSLMMGRDEAKELRAFNLAPFLRGLYDALYDERISEFRKLSRRRAVRAILGAVGTSAMTALAVGGLAWLYISGRMTLAAAGAAIYGLTQLAGRLAALHFSANSLYEETPSTTRTTRTSWRRASTLGCRSVGRAGGRRGVDVIEVDVGEKPELPGHPRHPGGGPGQSGRVRRGEVIALVGENGSGKTTLAKLIAGPLPSHRWGHPLRTVSCRRVSIPPHPRRPGGRRCCRIWKVPVSPLGQNIRVGRHDRPPEADPAPACRTRPPQPPRTTSSYGPPAQL